MPGDTNLDQPLWFAVDPRPLVGVISGGGSLEKILFALGPLLASLGMRSPILAASPGGLVLDCIPGFCAAETDAEIARLVQNTGCVFGRIGFQRNIEPGWKTAIAAFGGRPVLLHVHSENAADAEIANESIRLGGELGSTIRALITRCDGTLGASVGDWLSIKEAVACLDCRGPDDLQEVVLHLAAQALILAAKEEDAGRAFTRAASALASGEPRRKLDQVLSAQGANLRTFAANLSAESLAPVVIDCGTHEEGVMVACDPAVIADIVRKLQLAASGADVRYVGIDQLAKVGEPFGPGCTMGRIHAFDEKSAQDAAETLSAAFKFSSGMDEPLRGVTVTVVTS